MALLVARGIALDSAVLQAGTNGEVTFSAAVAALLQSGGGGSRYTHTQIIPAAAWVVHHELGRKPSVLVIVDDVTLEGEISYPNDESALVQFNVPQVGSALCY